MRYISVNEASADEVKEHCYDLCPLSVEAARERFGKWARLETACSWQADDCAYVGHVL